MPQELDRYFFRFFALFFEADLVAALVADAFLAPMPNALFQLSEYLLFAPIRTIVTVCSPSLCGIDDSAPIEREFS